MWSVCVTWLNWHTLRVICVTSRCNDARCIVPSFPFLIGTLRLLTYPIQHVSSTCVLDFSWVTVIEIKLARINDLLYNYCNYLNYYITAILGAERRALVSFRRFRIEAASSSRFAASWHETLSTACDNRAHRTWSLATRLSTIKRRDRRSPGIVVRTYAWRARGSFAWVYLKLFHWRTMLSSTLNGNTNAGCEERL